MEPNRSTSPLNILGPLFLLIIGIAFLANHAVEIGIETFLDRYWWVLFLMGIALVVVLGMGIVVLSKRAKGTEDITQQKTHKVKQQATLDDDDPISKDGRFDKKDPFAQASDVDEDDPFAKEDKIEDDDPFAKYDK